MLNTLLRAGIAVSAIAVAVAFAAWHVPGTARADGPIDYGSWQPSGTEENFDLSALALTGFAAPTAAAVAAPPAVTAPPPASAIEAPIAPAPLISDPASAAAPAKAAPSRALTLTLPSTGDGADRAGDRHAAALLAALACGIAGLACYARARAQRRDP